MKKLSMLLISLSLFVAHVAAAAGWQSYDAAAYGYSMLIPPGTQMVEKEWPLGWGGMSGIHDGVEIIGVAKLGAQETAAEIEKFGVLVTGIPGSAWTVIDSGSGHGWSWYKTVKAEQGGKLVYGGYGVGPRGSYLILVKTTAADYAQYRDDYEDWYHSVKLN